jgi:hypothetical protein
MDRSIGRRIAGAAAAIGVLLGGAGVAAWASSELTGGTASTVAASGQTKPTRAAALAALPPRTDHGSFERLVGGKWVTVTLDRGTVAGVAGDRLTLVRPDGHEVTFTLTPATRYRGIGSAADMATKKKATVASNADGTVRRVLQRA